MDEFELHFQLIHDTRCCKYSQVPQMMGENIARNVYS